MKSKKSKSNKNNYKRNKRKNNNNTKGNKVYSYQIRTPIIEYATPTYTEQNLSFDIYGLLLETEVFTRLSPLYTQVKLNKIVFNATPRVVNALDPSPIWIYLDREGAPQFNYSAIPQLQGSRSLPIKHYSLTSYSATGRQTDFHYWRDIKDIQNPVGLILRLRSAVAPTDKRYWSFQMTFYVSFRGLKMPLAASTKVNSVSIKNEKDKEIPPNEPEGSIQESVSLENSYSDEEFV